MSINPEDYRGALVVMISPLRDPSETPVQVRAAITRRHPRPFGRMLVPSTYLPHLGRELPRSGSQLARIARYSGMVSNYRSG